ncbi:FAD-dependent oxidoreductase [Streptomyces roseoverticillatus]|uniref:FAD-dependent oxidoreductase n=1 Tax=Streptomyces roseoverticillatus TaxID=66429 RepID=UPI0004C03F75
MWNLTMDIGAGPPSPEEGSHSSQGLLRPRAHAVVVGGGIVGLAVARELIARGSHVTLCEKEDRWGAHQTGRNSQVAHAGVYYRPGSGKARLTVAGNRSIAASLGLRPVALTAS